MRFSLWKVGMQTIPSFVWPQESFCLLWWVCLQCWVIASYECPRQYSAEGLRGTLGQPLLTRTPAGRLQPPWPSQTQSSIFSTQEEAQTSGGNHGAHLLGFAVLSISCHELSGIPCLKTTFHGLLSVPGKNVNRILLLHLEEVGDG